MISNRYQLIRQHLSQIVWPVITFEFWFSLIYIAGLSPLAAWLLNRLVVSSDQLVISNHELLTFFLSIRGILFLLFSISLFLALGFAEQAGLLILAIACAYSGMTSVSSALWEEIGHFPALVRLGLMQAVLYSAACIPFGGGLALTYLILLGDRDLNYYLSARPWEWWVALAIATALALCFFLVAAWLFVRWLFAVPALVFEDAAPADALKKSWKRTRGLV
jgi:glycerophosphoryl diester phosphodiesterase